MPKKIILVGGGGHCKACVDIIEKIKEYKITGIIDNIKKKNVLKYKIIGQDKDLKLLNTKIKYAFITIGQIKNFDQRIRLFNKLKKLNYKIPTLISPNSLISNYSLINQGTIIMNHAIIGPETIIEKNCIINNKVLIEHESKIGNNCHISTGAKINGNVSIGNNTFIGSGVIIKNNVKIGSNVIIGASVYVDKDIEDNKILKK